jgi:hypothetical protein
MKRKSTRANNAFLLGSILMIVLVLIVVVLFLFMSFKLYDKKNAYKNDRYEIVLGSSTLGSPLTVYMNDSLLFNGTPQSTLTLSVGRFAEESSLLVVDGETDKVTTIELSEHSETVQIGKNKDGFFREQQQ